jgi:hypothetical protein
MDRDFEDAPCCRIEYEELEFLSSSDPSPTGAFGEIRFAKLRYVSSSSAARVVFPCGTTVWWHQSLRVTLAYRTMFSLIKPLLPISPNRHAWIACHVLFSGVDVAVKKIKKQMTQRELDKVRFEVEILTYVLLPHSHVLRDEFILHPPIPSQPMRDRSIDCRKETREREKNLSLVSRIIAMARD